MSDIETRAFTHNPTIDLPAGTVGLTPQGKRRPTKYDWDSVRDLLEANPGLWVLTLKDVSSGMYSWVRKRYPPGFEGMGGQMQISLRNQQMIGKTKYGDLWLRWIPEGWTDEDQARAEAALDSGEGAL
jgi:hypothetical protein